MFSIKLEIVLLLWVYLTVYNVKCKNQIVCELAAFIEDKDENNARPIDAGKTISEFSSCSNENEEECKSTVEKQVIEGTNGGNFTLTVDDKEGYTVGDILCDKADAVEENVRWKIIRIYWRLCEKEWKKTSFRMPEFLCCEDGLYIPCQLIKST
ncbi:uncharacterized protein LOC129216717 [Uloborus diversus]|uniref:uncharacterized protein LOC129216717 n=1 Tax=Uloborus diversus TaxID=327109 RepID=UPI00240A95B7|nr:uncharacterized protein LOC129216717 [Uloborus diversus]